MILLKHMGASIIQCYDPKISINWIFALFRVFSGFSSKNKSYLCLYVPSSRLYIARHVVFNENVFPSANHISSSVVPPTTMNTQSNHASSFIFENISPTHPQNDQSLTNTINFRPPLSDALPTSSLSSSSSPTPPPSPSNHDPPQPSTLLTLRRHPTFVPHLLTSIQ